MSEQTFTVPKNLVDAPNHNGESKAWGMVARANDLNADMIVRTEHTADEYVYIVEVESA